jgi:periplasmic divalent cation tolerance protein
MLVILTTLHKKESAIEIGKGLLKEKLIACYNLFPIESAYWWKGEILEENEILMILKTNNDNFEKVSAFIKKHSGYEVPEVIALSPNQVNASYLKWVTDETK